MSRSWITCTTDSRRALCLFFFRHHLIFDTSPTRSPAWLADMQSHAWIKLIKWESRSREAWRLVLQFLMLSKYFCVALASEITSANEGAMSSYTIAELELHDCYWAENAHNIMKLRILRNAQRLRSLCGDQRLRSLRRYDQRLQSLCRYLTFQAYMQQHSTITIVVQISYIASLHATTNILKQC